VVFPLVVVWFVVPAIVVFSASTPSATSRSASESIGPNGCSRAVAIAFCECNTAIATAYAVNTNIITNTFWLIIGKQNNARIIKSIVFAITD
jgi:hypothetical protein